MRDKGDVVSAPELGREYVIGELGDTDEAVDFLERERTDRIVVVVDGMTGADLVERARIDLQEHRQMVQVSVRHGACDDAPKCEEVCKRRDVVKEMA